METKQCNKCKEIKPVSEFYKQLDQKNGVTSHCKECIGKSRIEYYKKNVDKIREYKREYREKNRDKISETKRISYRKTYNKEKQHLRYVDYYGKNAEKIRKSAKDYYNKNAEKVKTRGNLWYKNYWKNNPERASELVRNKNQKRKANPIFHLSKTISRLIHHSLKNGKNGRHWEDLTGFTVSDLIIHLEVQFKDGMTWGNQGKWHIDHIKPIASFSFTSYEDSEFKECWSLNNLQPLWAAENISKSDKVA